MQKLTTKSVKFPIDPAAGREKELFLVTPAIQWELIDDGMPFLIFHITCSTGLTLCLLVGWELLVRVHPNIS